MQVVDGLVSVSKRTFLLQNNYVNIDGSEDGKDTLRLVMWVQSMVGYAALYLEIRTTTSFCLPH